jgi:hypothetical protein
MLQILVPILDFHQSHQTMSLCLCFIVTCEFGRKFEYQLGFRSGKFEALAILSPWSLRVKIHAQIEPKYSAKSHLTRVAGSQLQQ